jgi:RNA polymerase sigma-70 factor (ECF subfamily)
VFEKALASLRQYDPRKGQVQTWLFAIAHNLAINCWKAETAHPITSLDDLDLLAPEEPPLEQELICIQDKQEILQAVRSLDSRSVDIIALKFGGGLTNGQIAGLVHLSESNVGVILFRALLKLRAILASSHAEVRHE